MYLITDRETNSSKAEYCNGVARGNVCSVPCSPNSWWCMPKTYDNYIEDYYYYYYYYYYYLNEWMMTDWLRFVGKKKGKKQVWWLRFAVSCPHLHTCWVSYGPKQPCYFPQAEFRHTPCLVGEVESDSDWMNRHLRQKLFSYASSMKWNEGCTVGGSAHRRWHMPWFSNQHLETELICHMLY